MEGKTLTIVGRGASWYACPFEGEVWGTLSCLATEGLSDKRFDKVFAFDDLSYFLAKCVEVAKARDIPIVGTKASATEKYPLLEVLKEFNTTYLRNTVSYMIALAILQGYTFINIYGVEQTEDVYADSKPFVTFWLGVASGRGIRYTIRNSTLPNCLDVGLESTMRKLNLPPLKIGEEVVIG